MAGRPREFDEKEALRSAMEVFWSHGFEATSMSALIDQMGVNVQSVYNCFGDKNQLFVRALELYIQSIAAPMFDILRAPDADLNAIERYFEYLLSEDAVSGKTRRGCLMVNTIVEVAHEHHVIDETLAKFRDTMKRAFRHVLKGAEKRHQISTETGQSETAEFLVNTVLGLMVMCKSGASRKRQEAIVRLALRAIRP